MEKSFKTILSVLEFLEKFDHPMTISQLIAVTGFKKQKVYWFMWALEKVGLSNDGELVFDTNDHKRRVRMHHPRFTFQRK